MSFWIPGDVSNAYALIDEDHIYPSHIAELRRQSSNVFNAGYYGSGMTHLEIQAALNACNVAGGGVVHVPTGTWAIDVPLIVYDNTILKGERDGATIIRMTNGMNDNGIKTAYPTNPVSQNISFYDFKLDCNGGNMTADNSGGISIVGQHNLRIENVTVIDNKGYAGIFLAGHNPSPYTEDAFFIVKNCRITGCRSLAASDAGGGIWVTNHTDDVYISNNFIQACTGAGIWLEDYPEGALISQNTIRDLTTGYGMGIRVTYADDCTIIGNKIYNNASTGLSLGGLNGSAVLGNVVYKNAGDGILLSGVNNAVKGNISYNNVQVPSSTGGIYIVQGSVNNVISGNRCFDNQSVKTQPYGIAEQGPTADYNIISNNDVTGNKTLGIYKQGVHSQVRNNMGFVTENSGIATVVSGQTYVTIAHGLNVTPTAKDISVTPTNSMGSATKFYVDTVGATTFRITVNADPGVTTATFAWSILVL